MLPATFETAVVGVTFTPHYPDNLHELDLLAFEAEARGEPVVAVIVRNPLNPYDANACEVHVPVLGEMAMVGHLPRDLAERVANALATGETWAASVELVRTHDDHPDRPGLVVRMERKTHE